MKIIDIKTDELYYDSGREEEKYFVSANFFKALKAGEIKYMDTGKIGDIRYNEIKKLDLNEKDFNFIFKNIAASEIGKLVIKGKMPLDTIL